MHTKGRRRGHAGAARARIRARVPLEHEARKGVTVRPQASGREGEGEGQGGAEPGNWAGPESAVEAGPTREKEEKAGLGLEGGEKKVLAQRERK